MAVTAKKTTTAVERKGARAGLELISEVYLFPGDFSFEWLQQ